MGEIEQFIHWKTWYSNLSLLKNMIFFFLNYEIDYMNYDKKRLKNKKIQRHTKIIGIIKKISKRWI